MEEATCEAFSAFVLPEGRLNSVLVDYLSQNNLGELLRLAETLASQKKPKNGTLPTTPNIAEHRKTHTATRIGVN